MTILTATKHMIADFTAEEDGSQVVEYSLVIALVSIALALGLKTIAGSTPFSALATRIAACFAAGATTC